MIPHSESPHHILSPFLVIKINPPKVHSPDSYAPLGITASQNLPLGDHPHPDPPSVPHMRCSELQLPRPPETKPPHPAVAIQSPKVTIGSREQLLEGVLQLDCKRQLQNPELKPEPHLGAEPPTQYSHQPSTHAAPPNQDNPLPSNPKSMHSTQTY